MSARLSRSTDAGVGADTGAGALFLLEGDLDFASVPALWRQADEQFGFRPAGDDAVTGTDTMSIDLSGVGHSDSAGVALLVDWLRQAQNAGRTLRFRQIPAQMRAIIRVCELETLLTLDD